ncbi:unnamed protein product [Rotaria sp. Silwood1]|nr:unnamed protein product [Rotaria sp. Silwood1]
MAQIKRKLTFNQSSNEEIKKLRNDFDQTITCIENLSNEFFYEIFDYIDGYEIYKAFSNLNYRFQQLLDSPSLLYKIILDYPNNNELDMNNYKQFLLINKHKMFSIKVWLGITKNNFFSWFIIDSSFSRLESLRIEPQQPDILISLLINLACLPRLFSLIIQPPALSRYLNDLYRLVFALPVLKSFIFFLDNDIRLTLPMANNQQLSTIEYFVTYQFFTFNEFFTILSYIPQIRCLKLFNSIHIDTNIQTILPITLLNLTDISIPMNDVKFDEFEIFIRKIDAKLKILRVTTQSQQINFLSAHRWEQLILMSLPQLKEFYLKYIEFFNEEYQYSEAANQFVSSFWIDRKWTFEVEIDHESIDYLVRPYKKRWYEYIQDHILNSSVEYSKSTRLTIKYIDLYDFDEIIKMIMAHVLTIAQIYHLEISEENVYVNALIGIISLLPELTTLKIHSLSLHKPIVLGSKELFSNLSMNYTSKIRKVYLQTMYEIQEFSILLNLCPYMEYLKVDYTEKMDFKFVLRYILKKIKYDCNEHLRLLCFRVPTADDETIIKLNRMINLEKLPWNFKIKRVAENLYFEWK